MTNESAFIKTKANLLFFTKGASTERVWYYDLSDIEVGKRTFLTLDHFEEFFRLLPTNTVSDRSWTATRDEINSRVYGPKAVNPTPNADRIPAYLKRC